MTDTDVTLGEIAEAEEAIERGEPGAVERREALSRRAGFESYQALSTWLVESIKSLAQQIRKSIGETELQAIETRMERAKTDPVWRAMLRASKFDETRIGDLVREVKREIITAPSVVPQLAASDSVPQIINNYGTIGIVMQAQGDNNVGGDVVGGNKTTNNTETRE